MKNINKRLKDLCDQSGKKQSAIAAAAGVTPQRLNDIIHGRKPLSLNLVQPICKAIGCTPNELFGWEDTKQKTDYLTVDYGYRQDATDLCMRCKKTTLITIGRRDSESVMG